MRASVHAWTRVPPHAPTHASRMGSEQQCRLVAEDRRVEGLLHLPDLRHEANARRVVDLPVRLRQVVDEAQHLGRVVREAAAPVVHIPLGCRVAVPTLGVLAVAVGRQRLAELHAKEAHRGLVRLHQANKPRALHVADREVGAREHRVVHRHAAAEALGLHADRDVAVVEDLREVPQRAAAICVRPVRGEVVLRRRRREGRPGPRVHALIYDSGRPEAARQIRERGGREVAMPAAVLERLPLPEPDLEAGRERRLPGLPHRGGVQGDVWRCAVFELGEHVAARLADQHCRAKHTGVALRKGEAPLLAEDHQVVRPDGVQGVVHEGDARDLGDVEVVNDVPGAHEQRATGPRTRSGLRGLELGMHLNEGNNLLRILVLCLRDSQAEHGQQRQ
mmetsp:Transcript_41616/g.129477  ORF Transcript_41616/g.129477 Transcript_41616/m.129477 type:complete len:391 (-) Transcript_41616:63-1235(-)